MSAMDDFDQWYSAYPRKIARGRAEKAYNQMIKAGVTHSELLIGARAYAAKVAKKDKEFIPYPATWLHDKSWLDEDLQPQAILSPEEIEANKDRADKLMRRGIYAPKYQ